MGAEDGWQPSTRLTRLAADLTAPSRTAEVVQLISLVYRLCSIDNCDRLYHNEKYVGKIIFELVAPSDRQFKGLYSDTKIISIPIILMELFKHK